MANMSYCRFRNTEFDLGDCLRSLEEQEELSREEYNACKSMFDMIFSFLYDEGIIEDDEQMDGLEERFNEFMENIPCEE